MTRGRIDTMKKPQKLAEYLIATQSGGKVSHFMKHKLMTEGLIERKQVETEKRGRGRPAYEYHITTKGQEIVESAMGGE